jgi:hypothetical protein
MGGTCNAEKCRSLAAAQNLTVATRQPGDTTVNFHLIESLHTVQQLVWVRRRFMVYRDVA